VSDATAGYGVAIAVVGLAARMPGAPSIGAFRALVRSGAPALRRVTGQELRDAGIAASRLSDARFVPVKGMLDNADHFDLGFFRMTPMLSRAMDPQHRLFLQCAWHALEDAGSTREPDGRRIGVFAGASAASSYYHSYAAQDAEIAAALDPFQVYLVNQPAALPNQVSFQFNLTGPSIAVQTACSTGLVALVAGCQSLVDVQCDAAIVGAVTVTLPLVDGYLAAAGSVLSRAGRCRPFDANADGTVPGEGVAAVVLKRLDDAMADGDRIYAVICGYGVTNDGARKVGFSAPSAEGQVAAVTDALAMAGIEPRDVGFLETHGTGTAIGDAIEISALRDVFTGCDHQSIALGATKAQIGHLDVAAGLAGFIKTVIAVDEGYIPPVCRAERPEPTLQLESSPFRIPVEGQTWADVRSRYAGISSFGMGGTNAHVVIKAPPTVASYSGGRRLPNGGWTVMPLSAPSADGLERVVSGVAAFMDGQPDINANDVGATLIRRRRTFDRRTAIVASGRTSAIAGLRQAHGTLATGDGSIAFAFTGQGLQPVGFARALHAASPSFAAALDLCRADLAELGCNIDGFLFGEDHSDLRDAFGETENAQPTLFAFAYAFAEMLEHWGVVPAGLIGHSLGEFVALCRAGVLGRRQALALVLARGRAMQGLPEGHMLAVAAPAAQVEQYLTGGAVIGARNSPAQTVVAGTPTAVARVAQRLDRAGMKSRMLGGRRAFHTAEMEPAVEAIVAAAERADLKPPLVPVASNLTGRFFPSGHAPEAAYFAQQATSPVRFADGVAALIERGCRLFVEIGAGTTLTGLIRASAGGMPLVVTPVMPDPVNGDPVEQVLRAIDSLWTAGAEMDWQKVDVLAQGRMISLPPYPFAETRCWVDAPLTAGEVPAPLGPNLPAEPHLDGVPEIAAIWAACLGYPHVAEDADYHRLGGDSLTAVRIVERLTDRFGVALMPSDLLTAGSPRSMADLIRRRRASGVPEAGVVIRARDPDPGGELLVLFHAIGGTAHLYGELLSVLPANQAVWMVQALPFVGSGQQPDTIEAAAALYLEALALSTHRLVHFAGASFGGLLAIEAARRWRAIGGLAGSVIMLDSPAPGHFQVARDNDDSALLAFMALLIGGPVASEQVRRLEPGLQRQRIRDMIAEYIPGMEESALQIYIDVLRSNAGAMNAYRPAPFDATPVSFLAAAIRDPGQPQIPQKDWARVIRSPMWVETVDGGHISLLQAPYVEATAAAIGRVMARASATLALSTRVAS
jgi:phthiocerol/phenolphthiocerol synthesis type-I polyketide synthase E